MNIEHDRSDAAGDDQRRAELRAVEQASLRRAAAARMGATRPFVLPDHVGGPNFARAFQFASPASPGSRTEQRPELMPAGPGATSEQRLPKARIEPHVEGAAEQTLNAEVAQVTTAIGADETLDVDSAAARMLADLLAVRPDGPSSGRPDARRAVRTRDDADAVALAPESEGVTRAGLPARAIVEPPPVMLVSPEVLDAVIRFATFTRTGDGHAQFVVGLKQGLLGGGSIRVTALGDRRVSLQVRGANGQIGSEEISGLLALLRRQRIEVVEVDMES